MSYLPLLLVHSAMMAKASTAKQDSTIEIKLEFIYVQILPCYIIICCLKDDNHSFTISLALVNSLDYNRSSNSLMDKSTIMQRRGARHHQRVVLRDPLLYWYGAK